MQGIKLFTVALAGAAAAGVAGAQGTILNCGGATEAAIGASTTSCRVTNTVTASVPTVARLEIDANNTTLNAPLAADFGTSAGVNSTGPTLTVRANAGYTLTASAAAPSWTGPSGSSKPAADLKMKSNAGAFGAPGLVGNASVATAGTNYVIGYNTVYNWTTDIPGSYSLVVNYTLTAP